MKGTWNITDHKKRRSRDNSFTVPDAYFETFNERLKKRLDKELHVKKSGSLEKKDLRYTWFIAAAAMVTGILLAVKIWIVNPSEKELRNEEITVFLQEEFYDLDSYDVEVGMTQSSVSTNTGSVVENENAYKNAIITYLVDEQIDLQTIVNEL